MLDRHSNNLLGRYSSVIQRCKVEFKNEFKSKVQTSVTSLCEYAAFTEVPVG